MQTSSTRDLREDDEAISTWACVLVRTLDSNESFEWTNIPGIVSGIAGGYLYVRGPIENPVQDEFGWTITRRITRVRVSDTWDIHVLPEGFDDQYQTLRNESDLDLHQHLF